MALKDGTPFATAVLSRLLFLIGVSAVVYMLSRILAAAGVNL